MKKRLFAFVGLGLLLLTNASASAQTVNMRASIPFNFVLEGRTLPGGEYTLRSLAEGQAEHAWAVSLRGADRSTLKEGAIFFTNPCDSRQVSPEAKLVFHRYDGEYFLSEIWMRGYMVGHRVPRSRREIDVARKGTPEQVVVVAELR
jgi:hypothetical protein